MIEIFKSYLKKEDYYIIIYSNYIYIYKYLDILKFSDKLIKLKLPNLIVVISGNDLLITKLQENELLIKGNINKVEKIYE
ncbi:MAG: YabP/YqfC family sporulation protein [Bacilli bacterium]|nr:YabP/YqfC family sporulation protein [Bacilli bacterium]